MRLIRSNRRGAALVEFTIVLLLLMTLVFGIIEFGLLIKDYLTLSHAARVGARSGAIGSSTGVMTTRIEQALSALDGGTTVDISLKKSSDQGTSWVVLLNDPDDSSQNDAAGPSQTSLGDLVRVRLTYRHQLVAVGILPFLGDEEGKMTIAGEMVMSRE